MSEEGRNPWAARDADVAKGPDEAVRPDTSNDETQVMKPGGQPAEETAPSTEPFAPPAPTDEEKAELLPDEPFGPPTPAKEEKPAEPMAPKVKDVPAPAEDAEPFTTIPPAPIETPPDPLPVSAQPSLDALRPKHSPEAPLRAEALISEDTDTRDRQIRQLRVFAGAALAVAVIALIIGLSGGGGQGTVNSDHIAPSAVTSTQLADGAVTASKIAPGVVTQGKPGQTGATGPRGPIGHIGKQGPAGAPGIADVQTITRQTTTDGGATKTLTVSCPAGKSVIYGGTTLTGTTTNVGLQSSAPAADGTQGWTAVAEAFSTTATTGQAKDPTTPAPTATGDWGLTVSVTCASFAKSTTPAKKSSQGGLKAGDGETVKPVKP